MSVREKKDGEDFVLVARDRGFGGAEVEALRVNGTTGKVTVAGGLGSSTVLEDGWDKEAADGAAATTTAEHAFFRASAPMTIKSVYYVPDATLTANDTTYATLTVSVRNADGTNQQTVASQTTKITGGSGNWSAWVAVALALTAANATLSAGQILTVSIAKASTGVVVPAGQLVVNYVLN